MKRRVTDLSVYVVRPPTPCDATDLGRMHCTVWQQTYADSMDSQAYAALSPEGFAESWRRTLTGALTTEVPPSARAGSAHRALARTVVVDHATDGIVGFITVGPPRDSQPPAPHQLWALNIAAEHRGTGLAQYLMAEVLGDGPAYLWVAHGNVRAITFYERHGFTADGADVVDGNDGITEVRMVRRG